VKSQTALLVTAGFFLFSVSARAQEPPAQGAARRPPRGPSLSLDPNIPQASGLVAPTAETVGPVEESTSSEWKFDVSGYFRAPMRMSWGPAKTRDPNGGDPGTQLRTPPLVPDANYIDWRYTNSMVGPWTELDFHYGNARVKATVQIASYNMTDSGFRRLEANLGINQSYLTINFPELINENGRLILTAGGFTNRYGAAGRYDGGKYETYLFGRTHVAGETLTFEYDVGAWTVALEHGFGAKLEPIPFYAGTGKDWDPYPGPSAQESTFVHHAHAGAVYKKSLLFGVHWIDTFANDNERAGSYTGTTFGGANGRLASAAKPHIVVMGADLKLLGGVFGDGYIGYSHLDAVNADYLADAIEVLHSYGGWQLHDNFFGVPGAVERATGKIDTLLFQHVFSFGQLLRYPSEFFGDGPDLIASVFAMYNRVSGATNPNYDHGKLKAGAEVTYLPLGWLGLGGRFDSVQPNLDDTTTNFSVASPRIILRSAFVTHEQIILQYSRYFYGSNAAQSKYPYNNQSGATNLGADKNAASIAAIIWF
jgi:hypothetical protein